MHSGREPLGYNVGMIDTVMHHVIDHASAKFVAKVDEVE